VPDFPEPQLWINPLWLVVGLDCILRDIRTSSFEAVRFLQSARVYRVKRVGEGWRTRDQLFVQTSGRANVVRGGGQAIDSSWQSSNLTLTPWSMNRTETSKRVS